MAVRAVILETTAGVDADVAAKVIYLKKMGGGDSLPSNENVYKLKKFSLKIPLKYVFASSNFFLLPYDL